MAEIRKAALQYATVSGLDKQANHRNSERCFCFGLDLANIDAWKLDGGLSVWID